MEFENMSESRQYLLFGLGGIGVMMVVIILGLLLGGLPPDIWRGWNSEVMKPQGYITCWDDPSKSVADGQTRYFDCDGDGMVDGYRVGWFRTIIVATQTAANQLRRAELQEALQYGTFKSLCGSGHLDSGTMTADSSGYPYVQVCGDLAPTPGHPLWTRWLGRDTPDGQAAQDKFQRLKVRQRTGGQQNSLGRSQRRAPFQFIKLD